METAAKVKIRSPNFPVISLGAALELAEQIYKRAQRHPLPATTVKTDLWRLKAQSTHGDQCLAALRAFTLIDVLGVGEKRQVRVTPNAAKILENHPERATLLREAALAPKVHQAIWRHYSLDGSEGLPPDATLQHFLLFDHDPAFNKSSIPDFVKQLRETVAFAQLDKRPSVGTTPADVARSNSDEAEESDVPEANNTARVDSTSTLTKADLAELPKVAEVRKQLNRDVFSLPEGNVVLEWPQALSAESYDDLVAWLELVKRKAGRTVNKPS